MKLLTADLEPRTRLELQRLRALVDAYREAMLAYGDQFGKFLPLREKALKMDPDYKH